MKSWALIPARSGSKSIPGKNMASLGERPLIYYGILAAKASRCFERICCSTDGDEIAEFVNSNKVEVDRRPHSLGGDEVPVSEVAKEWLARQENKPEIVGLVQPTSPFLRPDDIKRALFALKSDEQARSVQTICPIPHNYHAWNQRDFKDGEVSFRFEKERSEAYNKQKKPALYKFGNFVAARTSAIMEGCSFFATPSKGVVIDPPYDFDVDTSSDLVLAETLYSNGLIRLTHII